MEKILTWIKTHKSILLLLIIIGYLLLNKKSPSISTFTPNQPQVQTAIKMNSGEGRVGGVMPEIAPFQEVAPAADVKNRLVISESYLSLLVKDVQATQKQIISQAENLGGYMVNINLQNPNDAPTSTIIIRIPSKKLNLALEMFRKMAVKVVSENLSGEDVTDQYVDNEARLQTLLKTKVKFEEILNQATKVEDIVNVQREIINLQSQIDSIRGQQNYLEKSSQLAKLTIYLSTDELSLPYTPSESWRPAVIFKQAVRSLINSLRKIGTLLIWLTVYSVIWLPIAAVVIYLLKIRLKTPVR